MDYRMIQQIAQGVVDTSAACDGQLFTGTVSNDNPLRISLGEESGSIELDGDDIILTQAVVSKKIYIKKHKHEEDEALTDYQAFGYAGFAVQFVPAGSPSPDPDDPAPPTTLPLQHKHAIHTSTLDAWCTEYGHKLPVDPEDYDEDGEQTVITINRGLEKGDKVIMTRVSNGQQFVVLSRYFEVDKPGEDDE
jgi:hypothetical protein